MFVNIFAIYFIFPGQLNASTLLPCYCDINSFYLPPSSTIYAKTTSFEAKKELDIKSERIFNENLFCNTLNLEDEYFVHNSVVLFLLQPKRKKPPN